MNRKTLFASIAGCCLLLSGTALADVELTLEELPEAVRQTVVRETKGGTIHEIERDDDRGVIEYEVEFTLDAVKYEIDVAADGSLLRRHRD
jgi:uncharacterized membrane protein YkoI